MERTRLHSLHYRKSTTILHAICISSLAERKKRNGPAQFRNHAKSGPGLAMDGWMDGLGPDGTVRRRGVGREREGGGACLRSV